ncbi:type IV pilin [Halobaculum rubrum]|nr:type IV pilin [Halobaculum rubrum]
MLVLATVALSAAVGAATLSATGVTHSESGAQSVASGQRSGPTAAVVDLVVTDGTITLTHRGGDTLDVRRLRVVIRVDGSRLRHQPPVPFFAARGFDSGPTGPFNLASDHAWSAGESTSVTPAGTNHPELRPGSRVEVSLFVGSQRLAAPSAVAG